jgi:hypothetical protein
VEEIVFEKHYTSFFTGMLLVTPVLESTVLQGPYCTQQSFSFFLGKYLWYFESSPASDHSTAHIFSHNHSCASASMIFIL